MDFPVQPQLLTFDFNGKCKSYLMPDGNVAIVDANLKLLIVPHEQYMQNPAPTHWAPSLM